MSTPETRVEEWKNEFRRTWEGANLPNQAISTLMMNEMLDSITTLSASEYERGKAEERERCMGFVRGSYMSPIGTKVATVLNALQDAIDPNNVDTLNNLTPNKE